MAMFIFTARSLLSTDESMATPSSVKASGGLRSPIFAPGLDIAICDLQFPKLFFGELEHEIFGEAATVAFDGFVKAEGGRLVQLGQVRIKHDLLAANKVDASLDEFERYWRAGRFGARFHRYEFLVCKGIVADGVSGIF